MTALQSKSPLTAPKEGADARVGQELGDPMGWLIRRTKRVEELLAQPAVMAEADEIARHLDRFCFCEEYDPNELEVSILPTRSKSYITIYVGARQCESCGGVGRLRDGAAVCSMCHGTGYR